MERLVRVRIRILLLALALVVPAAACGPPAWLVGADDLAQLLGSGSRFGPLAMAADPAAPSAPSGLLLVGLRRVPEGGASQLFAVRCDPEGEGRILGRRLLGELEADVEVAALRVAGGEGGFAVAVHLEREAGEKVEVRYRILSAAGEPRGGWKTLMAFPPAVTELAVSDLHLLWHGGRFVLVYRADFIDEEAGLRSVLAMGALDGEDNPPVLLEGFQGVGVWRIDSAAASPDHLAVVRSSQVGDQFSVGLTAYDAAGARLGWSVTLYEARYHMAAYQIWEQETGSWLLLWGAGHRYWFHRVPFGEAGFYHGEAEPREIRFPEAVLTWRVAGDGFRVVLQGARRLVSLDIDAEGSPSESMRELVGREISRARRLHVPAAVWIGDRLATLLLSEERYAYRLLEP